MKHIHILPEYWNQHVIGACGWIRLLNPLLHPEFTKTYRVTYGYSFDFDKQKPDLLIIERLWHPMDVNIHEIMNMLEKANKHNIKIIYSIDDNLFEYPHYQNSNWFNTLHISVLNLFLQYADVVVVSTPALRDYLLGWNKHIRVILNALDPADIQRLKKSRDNDFSIGYLASPDNVDYLFGILEQIIPILDKYHDHVKMEICGPGIPALAAIHKTFSKIRYITLPASDYKSYQQSVLDFCRWDIALAPMANNEFTRCKSDMKFLDFTKLGIAGIYEDFTPYALISAADAGIFANHNWGEKIENLLEDQQARDHIREKAIDYVTQHRSIDNQINSWKSLLDEI